MNFKSLLSQLSVRDYNYKERQTSANSCSLDDNRTTVYLSVCIPLSPTVFGQIGMTLGLDTLSLFMTLGITYDKVVLCHSCFNIRGKFLCCFPLQFSQFWAEYDTHSFQRKFSECNTCVFLQARCERIAQMSKAIK